MDENTKKIQTEIAKDKIQIILSSIALAVLIIMEFYIMINFKSNFMAMAVGILLMIVALFFLISAMLDISLKQKNMEQEKYEEIYNAQKASYLVIKKSFDEMDQRLRAIEENSALPAEDIINAQKAVAKVTISRSKENTDALMNSNDELINQLVNIQEKLENSNSQILEKQQTLLKETNLDIQQKIAALTSQISNIEGKIQNGIPVMAQPMQMQMTPPPVMPVMPEPVAAPEPMPEPVMEDIPDLEDIPVMEEPVAEEPPVEEVTNVEDIEIPEEVVEPAMEETPAEEIQVEQPIEDVGLDLDAVVEEESTEEPVEDLGLDLDAIVEEPAVEEEIQLEELPEAEEPVEDIGLDLDAVVEEESTEEPVDDLGLDLDAVVEEAPVEEVIPEEPVAEEAPVEEVIPEEPVAEEAPVEEIIPEEPVAEEAPADDIGANLDALLEEVGDIPEEEPEPEPEPEPEAEPEPEDDSIVIPDVGIDLTDPNRVMSPEEIEKLFANI